MQRLATVASVFPTVFEVQSLKEQGKVLEVPSARQDGAAM